MLDIDFLPAQYSRRQSRQRSQPWHAMVGLGLAAMVALGAARQYRKQAHLESELKRMEPSYEGAVATSEQLGRLQSELKAACAEATLLTYLRHPWPRTQLLQALLAKLPDAIELTELDITLELAPAKREKGLRPSLDDSEAEKTLAALPPAERDLAELREQNDPRHTVIRLSGTTTDSAALHRYLGRLAPSDLFCEANLESIEGGGHVGGTGEHFRATVIVRRGYGQPGGPTGPVHEALADRGDRATTHDFLGRN